jgi:dTDP-4-amino-4,6-dideoxygalactose transaminase
VVQEEIQMKLAKPSVGFREAGAVYRVLRSTELTQGKVSSALQNDLEGYTSSKYAFVTSSATTALHLALDSLNLEPGSEVLVSDFSFPASANAIVKAGFIPKFVDIDLNHFNMDVSKLAESVTSKTRVIMPVHAFGAPANLEKIQKFALENKLRIIADAACSLGAKYCGTTLGDFADATVFSFHPRKVITSGEGGAVITNDASLAETISVRRSHGSVRNESGLIFVDVGFNFRMSDINAAVARVQLRRISSFLEKRREIAHLYNELLAGVDVCLPPILHSPNHTYQSYVVLLPARVHRNLVIRKMRARGVETTLGTYAMHSQPFYQSYTGGIQLDSSRFAQDHSLSLPIYADMRVRDVKVVVSKLRSVLEEIQSGH